MLTKLYKNKKELHDLLSSLGPYEYFLTIAFQRVVSEKQAIEKTSLLIRRVQKLMLGKRYLKKHGLPFEGVAIMEIAPIFSTRTKEVRRKKGDSKWGYAERGGAHFHIMLKRHPKFTGSRELVTQDLECAFRKATLKITLNNGRRAISRNNESVLGVYNEPDLISYLLKDVWKPEWTWDTCVYHLCASGLT